MMRGYLRGDSGEEGGGESDGATGIATCVMAKQSYSVGWQPLPDAPRIAPTLTISGVGDKCCGIAGEREDPQ